MNTKVSYAEAVLKQREQSDWTAGTKNKITIGGASIFSLLVVLCLSVFSIITVITADRELELSQKASVATKEFYDAEFQAEQLIVQIKSAHTGDFVNLTKWINTNVTVPYETSLNENGRVMNMSINVPMGSTSSLKVDLIITKKNVIKKSCRAVSAGNWETTALPVWDGGFENNEQQNT